MKAYQLNRSQSVVGIASVGGAVLIVLSADHAGGGAAAIGVPGLGLIAASSVVRTAGPG